MTRLVLLLFLGLSACAAREVKPTEPEMDRIEVQLAQMPCVGRLADWERIYLYHPDYFAEEVDAAIREGRAPRRSGYDRTKIEIHLRQANFEEFGEGRKSYADYPRGLADTDDRAYRIAYGSYDVKSGKLDLAACGAN
ncbi:hypothetical protein ASD67_15555 [Sphingopyxis sp. Root1497]|uniref:hypothetical protein n=1 Tax=Sphingopyxis sp. Root1497 TaxID=1736474 RepID=UPI0006FEF2D1|nr:hypothetical protein [Sphingopyxis sp. Root1497]KQZ60725.1 hypothetical protein ASD67_15555 [Sphingopyxis sp. Root1497]